MRERDAGGERWSPPLSLIARCPGLREAGGGGEGGQGRPSCAAGAPGHPLPAGGSGGAGLCRLLWEGCSDISVLSRSPKYRLAEVNP